MSEEFAFKQILRDAATIDGDKGVFCPTAVLMKTSGYQLFTGSAFAGNQHGGIITRDF